MIEDFDPDAPSPEAVWARARADYAAGESASTVCERYRLTRSTFFARAKAEGWRRADGAGAVAPDPYVAEMEAALVFELMGREATPAYVLARRAWAMAEVALLQRRRIEAASWIRIARDLRKLVMQETGVITWVRAAQVGEALMPDLRPPSAGPAPEADADLAPDAGAAPPAADPALELAHGAAALAPQDSDALEPPTPLEAALPALVAPGPAGRRPLPEPEWGPLPMSVITSQRKIEAFLHGEFAEAWAAWDSADRSNRTADCAAPSPDPGAPDDAAAGFSTPDEESGGQG